MNNKYVFSVDPTKTVCIFEESPMVDECLLEKYKVEDNSTIYLLLTMR